ncbi:aminopeptidase N [Magnetovirga frankeli]|uniref:aminopeptidase N n=1 Tax=Magnetovirga frankeli TaxID=947516 RepID=UPI00129322A2|nr:aminopeptidase N [gamma proteobacterium SS-5]
MSQIASPKTHYLKDYQPPAYLIDRVELSFRLDEQSTQVHSVLHLRRNPQGPGGPLRLDGEGLNTLELRLDGRPLVPGEYGMEDGQLSIEQVPQRCRLESRVEINPAANTALEGLYLSSGLFCTQCEAEGFRRISWFIDRPDVMACYRVRIEAERQRYPVLLSNGNPIEQGELAGGRHYAVWDDPFPKPCYLFALVAGDLSHIEASHQTPSGRRVRLRIYSEAENIARCQHAMDSLIKAMLWDERTYGRECDLDVYNIVAVNDFNMGAMENKGLNIFNAKFVLASPESATDADFQAVEGVIAHEYFHNWSGNRVTCRDWFQLSLKEGFTVFRDQEFSADMNSRGVKRIEDVRLLRTHQFAEDAGPMAHPVRPESYVEINNFYTLTVYEKGAELVRMQALLLGPERFRQATDLYFQRHDGQAVTIDDFVACMAEVSGRDLGQFKRWYAQAGTPEVRVEAAYEPQARRYRLRLSQDRQPPLHIPLVLGLLGPEGEELLAEGSRLLELTEASQEFVFEQIARPPLISLNRGFSAPVKIRLDYSDEQLGRLMAQDSDGFNRWDAAQTLSQRLLLGLVAEAAAGRQGAIPAAFIQGLADNLADQATDPALLAETLSLPSEGYLAEQMECVDVDGIHQARERLRQHIGSQLHGPLLALYERCGGSAGADLSPQAMGRRQLRNLTLGYLMASQTPEALALCLRQFEQADNMTERLAALALLAASDAPQRSEALEQFQRHWQGDALVMDKWFGVQASASRPETLQQVRRLMRHPAFSLRNPNRVRALISTFCNANPVCFHAADGSGYAFCREQVLALDGLNPQVAARLVRALVRWRRYPEPRRGLMQRQLQQILAQPGLSGDVHELVSKGLG